MAAEVHNAEELETAMNAFGVLLWGVACVLLAFVYGCALWMNGLNRSGWIRTDRFYVITAALTLPFPLWLLTRAGPPPLGGLWVLAAAVRQMMCLPLFLLGAALAAWAAWQRRPFVLLTMTALLNLGGFAYLYLRAR